MEIAFRRAETLREKPLHEESLGFGRVFSDYMFSMRYTKGQGWHDPEIGSFREIELSPAATVLHYSQEVFEGLKAYHAQNGTDDITLFRARDNCSRMNRSAKRLAMPEFDEDLVHDAIRQLVEIERDWVPRSEGTSLYIRPNYLGIGNRVGVSAADEYLFYIITGPVGPGDGHGTGPARILIEKTYTRSSRGGTGFAKTGNNYAAGLLAEAEAKEAGCDHVLWLDAAERRYAEEVGAMNIAFVIGGTVVTPPLGDTILAGITRDSVLQIARGMGTLVEERRISVDEILETARSGEMTEAFGTATAAGIQPIGEFVHEGEAVCIADGKTGPLTRNLRDTLTGIQYSRLPDAHGWVETVAEGHRA